MGSDLTPRIGRCRGDLYSDICCNVVNMYLAWRVVGI